jgi:lambda family phage portal protein
MSYVPTAFERALAKVAPGAATSRMVSRVRFGQVANAGREASMLAGEGPKATQPEGAYATTGGGAGGWFRRWFTTPRDAAADTLPHLKELRAQSRDLARKEPYARSALHTKANRAVGTGLALSAQPRADILGWSEQQLADWRGTVQAEWSLYADSPDSDWLGQSNVYDQQWLVLLSALESGDSFTVLPDAASPVSHMPYRLRTQLIEADRVGNPLNAPDTAELGGGVRRSPGRVEYFVYDRHPGSMLLRVIPQLYSGRWIAAVGESGRRRILHHFRLDRPEQPRGVPDLAACMALFKQLGTYKDSEIKAAIANAFTAMVIETENGQAAPIFGLQNPDPSDPTAMQATPQTVEAGPAAIIGLVKGEKIAPWDPKRPNVAFAAFAQAIVDQLGAGTLIGPEILGKKFNTSYTAARAAFLDAWTHIRMLRRMVVTTFCQPLYETWMSEAVVLGRVKAPGFFKDPLLRWAYTRAAWIGDSQGSINPKDEVTAFVTAIDARLSTRERATWELYGVDWTEIYGTLLAEHQQLKRDDMLPVPKAGAAAPAAAGADDKAQKEDARA